jgi:hypothetical protein
MEELLQCLFARVAFRTWSTTMAAAVVGIAAPLDVTDHRACAAGTVQRAAVAELVAIPLRPAIGVKDGPPQVYTIDAPSAVGRRTGTASRPITSPEPAASVPDLQPKA